MELTFELWPNCRTTFDTENNKSSIGQNYHTETCPSFAISRGCSYDCRIDITGCEMMCALTYDYYIIK